MTDCPVRVVRTERAGKEQWVIIFGHRPRFVGEKVVTVVDLTWEEGMKLSLGQAVEMFKAGRLESQKKQGDLL